MQYPKMYLYRQIVQAKLFIDTRYGEPIQVSNIAGEASFSKFHFIRIFKKAYGRTPHQYLTFVRIETAKRLLKSDLSVMQVCHDVGFESIGSFSSLFKKIVHTTPSAYQHQQRLMRSDAMLTPLKYVPGCFANYMTCQKKSNFEEAFDGA